MKIITASALTTICIMAITVDTINAQELDDRTITVTATRTDRNIIDNPLAESAALDITTSTVTANEIKLQCARTVVDAIEYAPGIFVETRGRKVKQFASFRNQIYPYPDYAINGIWQREFHELPYFYPASHIDKIEVVRSSSALLMGLSGQVGVINVVPKKFDEPTTYAELEYGRFNTINGSILSGAPLSKGGYTVGGGLNTTDGKDDMNAEENMYNATASFDWELTDDLKTEMYAMMLYGDRQLKRGEAPAGNRFQTTDERFDPFTMAFVTMRNTYTPSDRATTTLILNYINRDHDFKSGTGADLTTANERDYEYTVNLMQALALTDHNILRMGALYNHWIAPNGKRFYVGRRCDLHTMSAVVVDEQQIDKLTLDAGLRYIHTYIDEYGAFNIEGSGKNFASVEPITDDWEEPIMRGTAGARYKLDKNVTLYCSTASGVEEPRTGTVTTDFSEPENESRTDFDIGVKFSSQDLGNLKIGAFYSMREDAILLDGQIYTNADNQIVEFYKNQDVRQYGLEAELRSATLMDHFDLFLNAVVMDAEQKSGGSYEDFPERPDTIISGGVYSRFGRVDVNLFAKQVSSYENNRFAGDGQYHPLGDYVNVDMNIGYRLGDKGYTRLYCTLRNLTDERYSTVVGWPDDGFRASAGIQHYF